MSAELSQLEGVEVNLIGGGGGIFEVRKGGELLWKKERGGSFPASGEIAKLLN